MTPKNVKYLLMTLLLVSISANAAEADRKQPVEIEADFASFKQNNQETEFSGNVVATQGSLKINASKVISIRDKNNGQIITATGKPTRFQQNLDEKRSDGSPQLIKGHADKIVFNQSTNTVVMTGNAFIDREGDTVSGPAITYNTQTSVYSVKGNSSAKKGGRVSVVLQPETVDSSKK